MIYQGWFETEDGGKMLLKYDTAKGDTEQRKINFINAAATAEMKTGAILLLNEEGRRRISRAKDTR